MKIKLILFTLATLCFPLSLAGQVNSDYIVDAINDWRSTDCNCGTEEANSVGKVHWDDALASVAQSYAASLAQAKAANGGFVYLSHVGIDGSTLDNRLENQDYEAHICLENLAYIAGNFNHVIDHWMNNPEACLNIMDKRVDVIGVGRSEDIWVLLLAKPGKKQKHKNE